MIKSQTKGFNPTKVAEDKAQLHWLNKKLEYQARKIAILEKKLKEKENYIGSLQTDFENVLDQLQAV